MRTLEVQTIGEYTIYTEERGGVFYRFELNGERSFELYDSLDYCLIAAVAAKHTGHRDASGRGVGTAADWFMAMLRGWKQ